MNRTRTRKQNARHGGTIVLMLVLITVVFMFIAFAVDIGRIQLAQLKLQTASDLASRAGAEAMSRAGDIDNLSDFENEIRDECDMVMTLNQLFGKPVTFDANAQISFGVAVEEPAKKNNGKGKGKGRYKFNQSTNMTLDSNSVGVTPNVDQFPMVFGGLLSVKHVDLVAQATSMVQERDIVIVVDKSTSMLENNAGSLSPSDYPDNLFQVEDSLYGPGDAFYPGGPKHTESRTTEFEIDDGQIELTKMQALKLAIYRFREVIDQTPGNEQLGLTAYSSFADRPADAPTPPGPVDLDAGLAQNVFDAIVTDGICDNYETPNSITETIAAELEDSTTGYDKFDFNYLKMRWTGNTNVVDGIEVGVEILTDPAQARLVAQPIMIVMTDGNHNTTNSGDAASPKIAAENAMAALPGLKIYTITFGSGANQTDMQEVASVGNGRHFHADDVNSLVEFFRDLAANAGVRMIE